MFFEVVVVHYSFDLADSFSSLINLAEMILSHYIFASFFLCVAQTSFVCVLIRISFKASAVGTISLLQFVVVSTFWYIHFIAMERHFHAIKGSDHLNLF